MTSRFSDELFEHPQSTPDEELGPAQELFSGLVPLTAREVLADRDFDDDVLARSPSPQLPDLFVPDHYEPNYAYPLLVWIENSAPARSRLERRMRQISDRNYFGVSIAATDADHREDQLRDTFARLRRQFHLNTERVYLLGCGAAGTQALATGMSHPDWFGGVAALSAPWPDAQRLLAQYDQLRGKRVLLGTSAADDAALLADVAYGARLLWTAGVAVTSVITAGAGEPHRDLLREIDRWVMQAIEQPELVC